MAGWDTLAVEGPMATTVGDTALMLSVMAGQDDRSPISFPVDAGQFLAAVKRPKIQGLRVAWSPDLKISPCEHEVEKVAAAAARRFVVLGCTVEQAEPDFSGVQQIIHVTRALRMVTLHAEKLGKWRDQMNPNLVWNIEQGFPLTVKQIGEADKERTALYHRVRQFFEKYDLLLTPTVAVPPFPQEMIYPKEINGKPMKNYQEWLYLTYAITITGLPVISVPCGFTSEGLPVGLQIVGRRLAEATVLKAAAAFEAIAPWKDRRPPVE
jgi:amidase